VAEDRAIDGEAETYTLKSPDETDAPETKQEPSIDAQNKKTRKIDVLILRAETFVKKPLAWSGAIIFAALIIFWLLANLFTASKETVYQPKPLRAGEAIGASIDDRELIAINRASSTLEGLIAKAALLYEGGSPNEALEIYERVSLYNESLSLYNLGVARMKKDEYKGAIEAFDRQIARQSNRTPGAINAAVCALKLNDEPLFRHYVRIAKEALIEESASPLYGYYYTLVGYYDDRPFDALLGAATPTIDYLNEEQNLILAKMRLLFDDAAGSIEALEKTNRNENLLTLGLLYARIGDYQNAADRLSKAINANVDVERAQSAALLVHLKNGLFKEASTLINNALKAERNPFLYPIRVKLKDRLFDVAEAQNYFAERLLIDESVFLRAMFAYAPYIMVDPNRSVTEIRKGQIALSGGEINEATALLEQARSFSSAGARMSAAIKLALNNRLILANQALAKAEEELKTSDSLEYNLALSYAQLGRFAQAYAHFRRAYYLNSKNVEAGVYAALLSSFAGADESRLIERLDAALSDRQDERSVFWRALLGFRNNDFQLSESWLNRANRENMPQYTLFDLFCADHSNRPDALKKAALDLLKHNPNDPLFNIFAFYADNKDKSIRVFSFEAQKFMARRDMNFDSLYYGSSVTRDLYIKLSLITGNLEKTRELLANKLATEKNEPRAIMQALIATDIYRQNFEEAYAISNALIDELGMQDSETLLQGAIASIGAGHKENAIALLQIAKNVDPKNKEARFALGLLYQEINNAKGAALEYSLIGNGRYESQFFDFDIRTSDDPENLPR
jgi:tetratricopeptide (TPR) repeat protein